MTGALAPVPGESLLGFLRRMADGQFYDDIGDFLAGFGMAYGRSLIEAIDDVERFLCVPTGSLSEIAPSATPDRPVLQWRFHRHHCAAICPVCLEEGLPHQQAWSHAFMLACPHHEVRLIGVCPMCQDLLHPNRGGLRTCACGCPLHRIPAQTAEAWETAVSALLDGAVHSTRALLPPALAFRTPADIGSFLLFLAGSEMRAYTGKPGKVKLPKSPEEARSFLASAAPLLCDWPKGFEEVVQRRLGAAHGATVPERLGKWYQSLMRFRAPAYSDFHEALGSVAAAVFDGPYLGKTATDPDECTWISAAEAARLLGVRSERVVQAVSDGEIEGQLHASGFGHRHTMVRRDVVEDLKSERARFLDKSATRAFLGITKAQYRLIEEAGVLKASILARKRPLVDGVHDRQTLQEMMERIARGATVTDGETVAFRELNLRFTTDKAALLDLYQKIFDGALAPCIDSVGGTLADFAFPRDAVASALRDHRNVDGWTTRELARLTGWKEQCIAHWCDLGLLGHVSRPHFRGTLRIIRPTDLIEFQARYVPVASLAKRLGWSSRGVLKTLADAGIEPCGVLHEKQATRGHLVHLEGMLRVGIRSSGR
ncbi:MAG: hypothetical protein ACP5DX_07895 [Paracoccaceae bacterium]